MPNRYYDKLTDKYYTEATIQTNLSKAYREYYLFNQSGPCEGCGGKGFCTAHIIPRARCKTLHIVSMIWNPENWFRACYICNSAAENVSSPDILDLMNFETIKNILERYDPERATKLQNL